MISSGTKDTEKINTMIREVCEALHARRDLGCTPMDGVWAACVDSIWETFEPQKRYDHCHLLIDWMVEAGWKAASDWELNRSIFLFFNHTYPGPEDEDVSGDDPDFRLAALTAAYKALTDADS